MIDLKNSSIVRGYQVFTPTPQDANAYIVMELMHHSLDEVLDKTGCLTELQAAQVIKCIAKGVLHCHQNDVVHHDLKLENILVKTNSQGVMTKCKITDFGLSRKVPAEQLVAGRDSRGTLEYAAPELLQKGKNFGL